MTADTSREGVRNGEWGVDPGTGIARTSEQSHEPIERLTAAGELLDAPHVMEAEAIGVSAGVGDPDVAPRAPAAPLEVVAGEVDPEPSLFVHGVDNALPAQPLTIRFKPGEVPVWGHLLGQWPAPASRESGSISVSALLMDSRYALSCEFVDSACGQRGPQIGFPGDPPRWEFGYALLPMKLHVRGGQPPLASGQCPHCLREAHFETSGHSTGNLLVTCPACRVGTVVWFAEHNLVIAGYSPQPRRWFPDSEYEQEIPEQIRVVLPQIYAAAKEAAWTLVGIGCRLAIERMVKLHLPDQKGMLGERLGKMKEKFPGLAGPLEHMEALKLIGNAAAHDSNYDLQEAEAKAAIEFLEEVLRDVYVLPAKRSKTLAALPPKEG